ncbi:hypothetical protein MTBBW1_1360005 [Desulfamplus magnetovallimortis]|uniref:Uncharacterized protein n=1 Tax=Desulfamplus magnetovallimortis TaxID=1246637 RepID=A0A1W1H7U9_9BACT|nr:hypothetical protein MTBBW1_1360005 [Desulfamplus magnetovallimortis]
MFLTFGGSIEDCHYLRVSIPSNRGSVSDVMIHYMDSHSYEIVSIPSNRGSVSDPTLQSILDCNVSTSQSPLIGAVFLTHSCHKSRNI